MPEYKGISGASCKVFLSATGDEIGWATGVNVSENIQTQRVDVIGEIDSQEIIPVRRTATISVDAIRISKQALEDNGVWQKGSTSDILNAGSISMSVIDETNGDTLLTLEGCRPTTRNFRVDSSSLFSENLSFEVRRVVYPNE
jgi:hypothetical protein